MSKKLIQQQAKEQLWREGVLSWKLDANQKELYKLFYESPHRVQTWLLARRLGKTYTLCVLALEVCLRNPNKIVKFVSPTKMQVNNNIRPLLKKILMDCPEDLQPNFKGQDFIYYFKNGSEIQLAGTDNKHAEKLRGSDSDIAIIDEAGSCDDLDYLIKSILLPTTLITNGKILLASTPPKDPDHDFIGYMEQGEARGSLIRKTINDNPRLSPELIQEIMDETGGEHTEAYRREYLCENIKDPTRSVIPEFDNELAKKVVGTWQRPAYYDAYESMDLGFQDLTIVLFGYYDFRNNMVVVEDELKVDFKVPNTTIEVLTREIEKKDALIWTNPLTKEQLVPTARVSDINPMVVNEIKKYSRHTINFGNANKTGDKDASVNLLREKLKKQQIMINPRCVNLIQHLHNVKWKTGQKSIFSRSPDGHHYDAVDALIYLIRAIDYRKNPYPAHLGRATGMLDPYINEKQKRDAGNPSEVFKKIFNVKR